MIRTTVNEKRYQGFNVGELRDLLATLDPTMAVMAFDYSDQTANVVTRVHHVKGNVVEDEERWKGMEYIVLY